MGAASGVSEPILFSVTASRMPPFLAFALCLAVGLGVVHLLRRPGRGGARWSGIPKACLLALLFGVGAFGLLAAVQLAAPPVLLKATERGLTSYMHAGRASGGVRLQMARHADTEGLFIPWLAMESVSVDAVQAYDGAAVVHQDVLAIVLRPGFDGLREHGVVVAPGVRRSTLDLPVPVPPGGVLLLAELRRLQQRFGGR